MHTVKDKTGLCYNTGKLCYTWKKNEARSTSLGPHKSQFKMKQRL